MVSVADSPLAQITLAAPAEDVLQVGDEIIITDANGVQCRGVVIDAVLDRPLLALHKGHIYYGHPRCYDLNHFAVGQSHPIPYDEATILALYPLP